MNNLDLTNHLVSYMLTGLHDCHDGTWTYTQGGLYDRLSAGDHPDLVARLSRRLLNACDGDYRNGTPQAHFATYPDS